MYYLRSRYYDPEVGRFVNADSQLNADSILGYNMFAYCENNPVNNVDLTGHFAATATAVVIGGGSAALLELLGIIIAAVATAVVVDQAASVVKAKVESTKDIEDRWDQNVYILTDPNDGDKVKYVGRTNNPDRRKKEHNRNPQKKNYEMTVVMTGLTEQEAKIGEQILISAYTLAYLDNARREIAVGNLSAYESNISAVIQIFESIPEDAVMNLMER